MSWGRNYGKTERINEPNAEDWKIHNAGKKGISQRKCNKCGEEIFFLQDDNKKWLPFNPEVSPNIPKGVKYADGYDKVKISNGTEKDKGFCVHFETCNG